MPDTKDAGGLIVAFQRQNITMNKILFILTSHADMLDTDKKTGVWLGEFTDPYYEFLDAGFEVVLASPMGDQPPIDETSRMTENISASNRRFQEDSAAQHAFANTITLENIKADDFNGVFFPGGHGPIWDLSENEYVGKLITDFSSQNKIVGAVCHGSAAFISAARQNPEFLYKKRVSCFSNAEEKLSGKEKFIPYYLEDVLKNLGAEIDNTAIPFASHTTTDDNIVTGQNPLSAGPTAKLMIQLVNSRL